MTRRGANVTMREVASSANSYAHCNYYIYQDTFSTYDTQFLQKICFHGFILFSVFLIPVYHYMIWYFSVMGDVKGEGRGLLVSKETGDLNRKEG